MPRTAHEAHGASTLTQAESRARTLLPPAVAQLNGALASALAGRFRVERVLGMGASGVVFRAFDREVAQWLAIKVLYRCEPHRLYRLKREFRALSEIAHENLVGVHELFVMPSGHAFFSMDLVHDAASFLEYHRAQDPSRLHASLVQLVRGVQHLHARGKLHRDLKPSNVLIDGEHRLRIVDFGLVGSLDEPVFGAEPAPIFEGTPAYAAPEQIDVRNTTPASDWYAIGVMLYEVLAGARPFEARGGDLMQLKASEDPAPPSSLARWPVPPALERVCMRLLERDPARRADGRELLCALDAHAPLALDAREWPFVGREAELRALEQAFTAARRPTLIEGASGVGKTSLAQRFLDGLEHAGRALVLRSRCFVFESVHYNALDGIVDALASGLSGLPACELAALLPGDIPTLARLFPVLRDLITLEGAALPHATRSGALSALRELLLRLAKRRRVVLFVDDLHWADADSAQLLHDLFEAPLPGVWLLATFRRTAMLARESLELERLAGLAEELALGPLASTAVVALASRALRGCTDDAAHEIARKSAGDPWLAHVLIRYASDGPVAPEAALREQLASLPAPARELLERVCVAGRRLPRALLLEGGVEPMAALRELRRSSTVRESLLGGSAHLEPYHDRVRELVIAQLPEPRRRELHGTLAERLKAHGAAYLDQVALHYFHAGMRAEAGAAAELAARDATQACAFHSAADLLDVALRCADSPADRRRLQLQAAEACTRAGRVLSAAQHYEAAADASDVSEQRVDLRLKALTAYCTGGHGRKGRELLSRSAAELGVAIEFDSPRFAAGVAWMARLLTVGGPRLRRSSSGEDVALRLLWQTAPALMIVDGELATQFAARAMLRAAELGERAVYGQALAFQLAVFVLVFGRSSWLHERRFAEARQLASHSADPWSERLVRVMHASARAILGHHALTLSECADIAHAQTIDAPFAASVRSGARALTLLSLLKLGRLDDFAQHVELWQAEALGSGDRHLEVTCRVFGTQRHLRAGDVARAVHELDAARAVRLDYVHSGLTEPWWPVQVALYQGDAEQAQAIYAASLAVRPDYVRYSAPMRLMYVVVDGLCAAALAASGREVEANLRRLARAARAVAGFRCTLARADAAQLAATLSHLRGERVPAERHLRAAIRGYAARGTSLHVAALQLALSQQQPADAEALARTALAAFAAQGVRDPRRWAAMVAPGWLAPLPREATRGTSSGHADV